uniref:Nudix hydrolase domain-containing protein n=1 Tax=Araucaria cunninghamii TaxID=56994 RepID=A0A0D6R947_ARACU
MQSVSTAITFPLSNNNEVFCRRIGADRIRSVDACVDKTGSCEIGFFRRKSSSGYARSDVFRLLQASAKKRTMSYSKKRPLAVAPLPSEDEALIEDRMSEAIVREHSQQEQGMLLACDDDYDGVIVDPNNLPLDVHNFVCSLKASLSLWRQQGKKGVWVKIPTSHAKLVPAAIEEGFWYHHAEPTYVMLAYWIPESSCTLPPNASHQVGVGGFVLNENNKVLVVQEKNGPYKGVWKIPTGVILQGEDIFTGAIREIKEETGVDTQFIDLVGFRHSHNVVFEKSDLFFLCMLRPLSSDIVAQELEIEQAQWMPLDEFVAQPYYKEHVTLKEMLDICIASSKKIYRGFSAIQTVSKNSNLPNISYYNIADMSRFNSLYGSVLK